MSRFYIYRKALFFDYRRREDTWRNKHFEDRLWHIKEEWFVKIGFEKKWLKTHDFYYDGHTYRGITLCGIEIGYGYSYESKSLADWVEEEHKGEKA